MDTLKNVAVTLCTSLIAIGFITKLSPRGKFNKSLKNIFSLIAIIIIISPLYNGTKINIDTFSLGTVSKNSTVDYAKTVAEQTVKYMEGQMKSRLKSENITVYYLKAESNASLSGTEIKGVVIKTDNNILAKKIIEGEFLIKVIG